MSDFDDAVSRLTAWVHNYGDTKPRVFIGDVSIVLLAARDSQRLADELAAARALLREAVEFTDKHPPQLTWWMMWSTRAARAAGGET